MLSWKLNEIDPQILFSEFHDLIIEAQEFKNFGFSLNKTLRMAIMRKRALFDDAEHLIEMIKAYKLVVKKLSSAEVTSISNRVDIQPFVSSFVSTDSNT